MSATWGGPAALWQCRRQDGVVEHLEEDEVRAALAAAATSVTDMPAIEDASHGAWKKKHAKDKQRHAAPSASTSSTVSLQRKGRDKNTEKQREGEEEGDTGPGEDEDDGKVHVKHVEMRCAARLAVRIISRLKSTAFANNGILSTRQGRQRWKKLACDRDLSKFGKSIKSLEANLVWSAVTKDFDDMRPELLHSVVRQLEHFNRILVCVIFCTRSRDFPGFMSSSIRSSVSQ